MTCMMHKELMNVIFEPLSIIFENFRTTREVLEDWINRGPYLQERGKEDPSNYKLVSLTLVPGKMLEQIVKRLLVSV